MMDERFKLFVEKVIDNKYLTDTQKVDVIKDYLKNPDDQIYDLILN